MVVTQKNVLKSKKTKKGGVSKVSKKTASKKTKSPAPTPVQETTPAPVQETTPVPVQETTPDPVQETSPAPVQESAISIPENEEHESAFEDLCAMVITLQQQLKTLNNNIKQLHKNYKKEVKELKKVGKKSKKGGNKKPRAPSGFAKPTHLSSDLCNFLNVSKDTMMARTDVTKKITGYIKEHSLQNQENKKIILPDKKLGALLDAGNDEVTYFNLQKYMKVHFIKKDESSEAPSSTA